MVELTIKFGKTYLSTIYLQTLLRLLDYVSKNHEIRRSSVCRYVCNYVYS